MNLPNKLTIARVIAVPFFIAAFYLGWYAVAFVIFIAASFTDMLDGQIARKNNLVTNFGKIMDPLADKLTHGAILLCLLSRYPLILLMLVLYVIKEGFMLVMGILKLRQGVIAAGMSGKIKTVLQMIAVCLLLLVPAFPFFIPLWYASQAFLWASLIMTVYSGVEYVWKNRQVFSIK